MTPLDHAHADMDKSDEARLRFYERLADAELFLLLETEPADAQISPKLFPLEDGTLVLAFDREERLAEFAGGAPYAALSGRALAQMLSDEGLGLGLNLEVAPSSIILPGSAITWLNNTLGHGPKDVEAKPEELFSPTDIPEPLLTALDTKLALATGLARSAYLCAVRYEGGAQSHMLAFINPLPGAEPALARAVNEALVFSGVEAGALDVAFFAASNPMAAKLAKAGLRFDLPEPEKPNAPSAPGMDPEKPPRL
ncbi:MAG: SseB family protein [Litoreibacter sp.]|nr:SseB family protein [Litoreibacter sp.]MCY4333380.1 SseB family protein [Litoreibacter sp.]